MKVENLWTDTRFVVRWGPNKTWQERYHSFLSSRDANAEYAPCEGSHLVLRMDKQNEWAKLRGEDAILVMTLGEIYGNIGYVGREHVERVKDFFKANGMTWRRLNNPPYTLQPMVETEEHNQVWMTLTMKGEE